MAEEKRFVVSTSEEEGMGEEESGAKNEEGLCYTIFYAPIDWVKMLAIEMHWSFVFGVVITYGISQGLAGSLSKVCTEYYMKDVQKVQPSQSQIYAGITTIPWVVKPLWGLLTDVMPIYGNRRRPYFILAGFLGVAPMILLSLHSKLHIVFAVLALTTGSTGVAIADVTIDAVVAQNSISHPALAPDMQTLCAMTSAIGALVGYFLSGVLLDLIGPMGLFGVLIIPYGLVLTVGVVLDEPYIPDFDYTQVNQKFIDATKAMWNTLKYPEVWRPCIYMYASLALSFNIHEGLFYWYTDSKDGPSFSEETVGFILSVGSIGSLLGAILYQNALKDQPFRDLLLWTQLLFGLSGMLDLVLVLRLNLKIGMPDYFFIVIDESVSKLINRLKWMPLFVLSTKLCPSGIEGTFFALLMSIDNAGILSSSWGGGVLLHLLDVTRSKFDNLWLAILIRNILRVSPLCLLFLIPGGDPNANILPTEISSIEECTTEAPESPESVNTEMVSLVRDVD